MNLPDALPPPLAALHREMGIAPTYARERQLTLQVEAFIGDLIEVGPNPEGRPVRLTHPAAAAWTAMRSAAAQQGITLIPISGFRSVARQTEILREKLASGVPIEVILRTVAAPGFSEHHTGNAIDIGSPDDLALDEDFARTTAFGWLEQHAADYGFRLSFPRENPHGISYEPWHWRFSC